jgi:hypothetical protein
MTRPEAERDERTLAVENASYRLGYNVVGWGLLASVMYRQVFLGEPPAWDLVTLVIAATVITFGYQALHRVLSRRALIMVVVSAIGIAAGALLLVLIGLRP